jgi:cation diffusion facilitator CzcD-associated flavoprotein CzcO
MSSILDTVLISCREMSEPGPHPASQPAPLEPVSDEPSAVEHVDVLILGAGLSGIGAACHLRQECPQKTFAILEARDAIGGTWDLFRYPGIRSDSDMFTLGYRFRPWEGSKALADGASILSYVRETAREHDVERQIRFGHRATRAEWSSAEARWTVQARRSDTGENVLISCDFLYACTGYYRYDEGYTPQFEGRERFAGRFVHAQHWPEDLDCTGKRVVVIGSGATAVTLVPALAEQGAHVTMLQRSPSYILSLPATDVIADRLRGRLPPKLAYAIVRWKNVLLAMLNFQLSRRAPRAMRRLIRRLAQGQLPPGYDVDTHFNPDYNPWDQRLCLVPDGDLFKSLSSGDAQIVTDRIATLTERGVELQSGEELPADVIVAATGLNLLVLGGIELSVDGRAIDVGETLAYKGMMLCGVPNLALTLGYTNASWTLKADLVAQYVCRVLNHMDAQGAAICVPEPPGSSVPTEPIIDLKSGYVLRAVDHLPRQAASAPWRLHQNYIKDVRLLRRGPLDDAITYSGHGRREQRLHQARDRRSPGSDHGALANGAVANEAGANGALANGAVANGAEPTSTSTSAPAPAGTSEEQAGRERDVAAA